MHLTGSAGHISSVTALEPNFRGCGPTSLYRRLSFASTSTASVQTALPEYTILATRSPPTDVSSSTDPPPAFDEAVNEDQAPRSHEAAPGLVPDPDSRLSWPEPKSLFRHTGHRLVGQIRVLSPESSALLEGGGAIEERVRYSYSPATRRGSPHNPVTLWIYGARPVPNATPATPHIWGGSSISGFVEINAGLRGISSLPEMSLVVRGRVIRPIGYNLNIHATFCTHRFAISGRGIVPIPDTPDSPHPGTNTETGSNYILPFSFPLCTHIDLSTERLAPGSVDKALTAAPSQSDEKEADLSTIDKKSAIFPQSPTNRLSGRWSAWLPKRQRKSNQQITPYLDNASTTDTMEAHRTIVPLPPTSSTSRFEFGIRFEVILEVNNGLMRTPTKIKAAFDHIPRIMPLSPPLISLEEHERLTGGPLILDPAAWFEVPIPRINGRIASPTYVEMVTLTYKVFVGRPLSYVRGTAIPLLVAVLAPTILTQAIFSSPRTLNVQLGYSLEALTPYSAAGIQADIGFYQDVCTERTTDGMPSMPGPPFASHTASWASGYTPLKRTKGTIAAAVWWEIPEKACDSPELVGYVVLAGKITLPRDLEPSCCCPAYRLEYEVQFRTPRVRFFEATPEPSEQPEIARAGGRVYASHSVEIATLSHR